MKYLIGLVLCLMAVSGFQTWRVYQLQQALTQAQSDRALAFELMDQQHTQEVRELEAMQGKKK
jgi:Tfp pilus assembly protein PilW